jgi:hypothetical protein
MNDELKNTIRKGIKSGRKEYFKLITEMDSGHKEVIATALSHGLDIEQIMSVITNSDNSAAAIEELIRRKVQDNISEIKE